MSNSLSLSRFTSDELQNLAKLKYGDNASEKDLAFLRRQLAQPNINPVRDCFFVYDGSVPVGYFLLIQETALSRGVLEYSVIDFPEKTLLTRFLIDAAIDAALDAKLKILHVDVPYSNFYLEDLDSNPKWEHVRTHLHLISKHPKFLTLRMAENLNVRTALKEDASVVTTIQNQAFHGSWGYCPNTTEEIEYRIFELPENNPDVVLILEENGRPVGYCWTHVDQIKNVGVIGMVGVLPVCQGKGFGKILTLAGLDHLQASAVNSVEITVDSQNPSAIHVYQNAGFELDWKSFWYEFKTGS